MAQFETRPVVGSTTVDQATFDAGLRSHMLRVYNYMASGLALSGIVALLVYSVPALNAIFIKHFMLANGREVATLTILGWIAILAPIGLILLTSFRANTMSVTTTKAIYWAIVALNGIGFTLLIYRYTGVSLARTFFITAAAFAALSLYGYTTKRSLSGLGTFLFMGLIGILIAGVVNIFVQSTMLHFLISAAGVLIFAGFTAYDTQTIKEQYAESWGSDAQEKIAIFGALNLYLDFVNLFQLLLSLIGDRD
ncbi:MAG: Bax inhibitor-1/YccA family protein [Alphaproteobacteria bacterium]|nr:Bax inhibitor-1/YccA family protein [Alphaproteobacteria bacterium]